MTDPTLSIAGPRLAAEVATLGAELVRLRDRDGRDLLWDGDPAYWTGRAPLLFPMVGRAKGDRIRVGGSTYPLPKHGFARHSPFAVAEHGRSACTLRLSSGPDTLRQYPFRFDLDVTFAIEGPTLLTTALVHNRDEAALPVSFGFHPALRWPLPYGAPREAHEILFERDEPAPIRRVADGLLTCVRHPSPVVGNRLVLRDSLFVDDALIFDELASRSVVYGAPSGPQVRVTFPTMPHLGIWTKPGAGFVCIEPWQGFASPEDFDGEFSERPGVIAVAPGARATFTMGIEWLPDRAAERA